jgi:prolyl oligopeptidase
MIRSKLLVAFLALAASSTVVAQMGPPVAPVRPVVDDYFGTKVTDPYRYMEDLKSDEVQTWMKGQAEFAKGALQRVPGRDAFLKRMLELDSSVPAKVGGVTRLANGKVFYRKRLASEDIAKLYMRDSMKGAEVLLADPDEFKARTGKPHALNYFVPSWDGRYVAYGISQSGSEDASVYVIETATKKSIDQPIDRCQFPQVSWLPDGSGFVYNRLQKLVAGAPATEKYQRSKVYLHKLGTDSEKDPAVLGLDVPGSPKLEPAQGPFAYIHPVEPYMFALVTNFVQNESALFVAPIAALGTGEIPWKQVCDFSDDITNFDVAGDALFLLSHKNASRFKILKTSLKSPNLATATAAVPEGPMVIKGLAAAKDALYVQALDGGIGRVLRVSYDGKTKPQSVPLPLQGTVDFGASDPRLTGVLLGLTSWINYGGIFLYDPATREVTDLQFVPKGPYDAPADLVAEEVKAKSWDGTMVPLSIVHKKGIKLDGTNPTWLVGYGAYGITSDPFYDHALYAWYERGGIAATAHVRGGGENGEDWYRAGFQKTKPNTWKDFIACAEYLIDKKYTSPSRLAGEGTSAGGILIGRALTERPDLFAVALPRVGCVNAVRMETTPNGVPNIPEFGSCETEAGFRSLYEMDALQHVRDGVKYPAVLVTHGANDPRVEPWQSAKFAARLQAATASGKPVLFRVDYEAGHGIGSTKTQRLQERADIYSFMLWQFGVKDFQPRPIP